MKPILFAENATAFTTNGLGRLEALSGTIEREINGIEEMELTVSVNDKLFSQISNSKILVAKRSPNSSLQAYRIYKISKPINGIVTINAEHISYQLSYIPVMPYTATSCSDALSKIATNAAETCPFTFSTDKTISANWSTPDVPTSARSILQGEEGSILQRFKGEYEFDNWNVSLKTHLGTNNGVVIRYGKNLVDLLQEESIQETYTGVCPFYKSDDYVLTLTEKVLHSANASNFPYQRTLPLDMSNDFEGIPSENDLRTAATNYMTENNIGVPKVSLEVEFVPLADTLEYKAIAPLENVELGDTVGVYFEKLGVNASAEVVRTIYDFVRERYEKVEIGSVKSSLSSTLANQTQQIENQQTWFEEAVQTATDLINGGLGGYIRTTVNSAGQPQEILVMDTDDISTATNVIRINKNGIGFSTTGYTGPFNSAWTIDGTFDASVVNVINLIAQKLVCETNDDNYKITIENGYFCIYKKNNGSWVKRIGIGNDTTNAQITDGAIALGTIPDLNADPSTWGNLFILLQPLQAFIYAPTRLYGATSVMGSGSLTFFNGTKLQNKYPTWVKLKVKGTDYYMLSGDNTSDVTIDSPTSLYDGTFTTGSVQLNGAMSYNSLLIIGQVTNTSSMSTILIPTVMLTTTQQDFQFADNDHYYAFHINKSGSNVVLQYKGRDSTGQILKIYGV